MSRRGERPTWRGPCPACGRLVPLTTAWHTWGHKHTLSDTLSDGTRFWCPGGYVEAGLREKIPVIIPAPL